MNQIGVAVTFSYVKWVVECNSMQNIWFGLFRKVVPNLFVMWQGNHISITDFTLGGYFAQPI